MPNKPIKEAIPDFLLKLYHILEVQTFLTQKPQFSSYICWTNDGTEVLIKNAKKIEAKVLPYFYRHKKFSSFIRQMNMYNFSRVSKISKQRNKRIKLSIKQLTISISRSKNISLKHRNMDSTKYLKNNNQLNLFLQMSILLIKILL